MNSVLNNVTNRIIARSKYSRNKYLNKINAAYNRGVNRNALGCTNLAHGCASSNDTAKNLMLNNALNIAIVSAYNDMLSAHQPYKRFPDIIKNNLIKQGVSVQFAGGVPAMCDGITQSQPGMELSLFSRDIIAQSTAIALSHNMFDGALYLGICDKIVPGLLIGALCFGHLPAVFVPGGPMPSGISNIEKAQARQEFAIGNINKQKLLESELKSYHSPGTCTFYGTANSNQMLMEIMGLQLPGSSFVNANTEFRDALTIEAGQQLLALLKDSNVNNGIGHIINEKSFVNAIVGLLTTGGSTNHTIHLIAIAKSAGIHIEWQDFHDLATVVPLITKLYPNGSADVNDFHQLGGMPVIIKDLLANELLHDDVNTILGFGLSNFSKSPSLVNNTVITWKDAPIVNNSNIIARVNKPFSKYGGLSVLSGNLGTGIVKTSAIRTQNYYIKERAMVFNSEADLKQAYADGLLNKNFIAILKYQGPKANGMPELHGLTPLLAKLQNLGHKVALITDGRMSGASGTVLSVIHTVPETLDNLVLANIINGDQIVIDVANAKFELLVSDEELMSRKMPIINLSDNDSAMGRELFTQHRKLVNDASKGATIFNFNDI